MSVAAHGLNRLQSLNMADTIEIAHEQRRESFHGLHIRPSDLLRGANRGIKLDNTLHVPPAFYYLARTSKTEEELRLLLDSLCYVELDR
jgi:hypothetical protein